MTITGAFLIAASVILPAMVGVSVLLWQRSRDKKFNIFMEEWQAMEAAWAEAYKELPIDAKYQTVMAPLSLRYLVAIIVSSNKQEETLGK